jgi:ABC-2 type transport system permease protein
MRPTWEHRVSQPDAAAGAIYDIGYQHYDGKRLGRAGAVRALYLHGLRTLFGIGRGGRAKIPPIALILFIVAPAIIQVAIVGLAGNRIQLFTHEGYFHTTVWIFGLFCAFQTPELVTGDQQYRILALYFSRALLRSDYVLARLGALFTALFVVGLLPHVILLVGIWLASDDVFAAMRASLPVIPRILAAAVGIALLLSAVSLMIAAVIRRRPFATAAILALFLLTSAFVLPLVMSRPDKMRYLVLASPMDVGNGFTTWVFDTMHIDSTVAQRAMVDSIAQERAQARAQAAFDSLPDSVRARYGGRAPNRRRFRRQRTLLETAGLPGEVYLATTCGLLILAAGVLTLRYRGIET